MNLQKLFETIERITGHQCLETEMLEIMDAVPNQPSPEKEELRERFERENPGALYSKTVIFDWFWNELGQRITQLEEMWEIQKSGICDKINFDNPVIDGEGLRLLKKLSFHAQTTGGTVGPDKALQAVIQEVEIYLSNQPNNDGRLISLKNFIRNKLQENEEMHDYAVATDTVRCWIEEYEEDLPPTPKDK